MDGLPPFYEWSSRPVNCKKVDFSCFEVIVNPLLHIFFSFLAHCTPPITATQTTDFEWKPDPEVDEEDEPETQALLSDGLPAQPNPIIIKKSSRYRNTDV